MTRVLAFVPALLAVLCARRAAACVFNDAEYTCVKRPPGDVCLRYLTGAPGAEVCEAYACGEGYTCDCSGTELCDLRPKAGAG